MSNSIQSLPPKVQIYLNNAKSMANEILKPSDLLFEGSTYQPYYRTPSYYYYYDSRPNLLSLLFPQRHVVHHVHHTPSKNTDKNQKENSILLLGTILTVASAAMLHTFAAEVSKRSNAIEDIKRFERDRQIAHYQTNALSSLQSYEITHIQQLQNEILTTYKTDAEVKLALKGMVTAGLLAGVGSCVQAYFETPFEALALASAILTVGGGFGLAIKSGLDSTNLALKHKAQDLLNLIQNLEVQFKK